MINYKIIENKLRKIIENNLIEKNDKILIAFSGGPDSVFLYYILKYLQSDFNLEISLLYVNHNLREDVEKDLNFVKNFSKKNEVSLYIGSVDVKEYSKINKKSIELSARELRYEKLSEFCNKIKYTKIATGHNLDDNVETLIFRLLRGTSIKGLKSIPQKRNEIIRPILNFEKKEILLFLNENGQNYITDYTNEENDYTRNYIRNKLFPMFSEINPSFRKKVNELIIEINKSEKSNCKNKNKERIILLMEKNKISLSRQKIEQIYNSFYDKNDKLKKDGNKEIDLGDGKYLRKIYDRLEVIEKYLENKEIKKTKLKKNQSIEWYTYKVSYFEDKKSFDKLYINEEHDAENIEFFKLNFLLNENEKIIIRKREEGDKIFINKVGSQKIKKILIDNKISKWERDKIPIIELEKENEKIILGILNIKYSDKLKKIKMEDIKKLQGNESILVIRRKNER